MGEGRVTAGAQSREAGAEMQERGAEVEGEVPPEVRVGKEAGVRAGQGEVGQCLQRQRERGAAPQRGVGVGH